MARQLRTDDGIAFQLLAFLESAGSSGSSREEICDGLEWRAGTFAKALVIARNGVCPQLGLAIPHPVPMDGWRYHLTGDWLSEDGSPAIADATEYALTHIEARLRSVLRDVRIALGHLDRRSIAGRKANLIDRHLTRTVATLHEIDESAA